MSKELKPCPFCGGEAFVFSGDVWCTRCRTTMKKYNTKEEAIEAWNKRPLEKERYFNGYQQGIQDCMEFVQKHVFFNSVV